MLDQAVVLNTLLSIIAFLIASFIGLVVYVYKRTIKSMDENSDEIQASNEKNDKAIATLSDKLEHHEASMGMASKAIHGDMLEVQKNFHELKVQFAQDIIDMRNEMSDLNRGAKELVSDLKISTDQFNDKYTKIMDMQGQINDLEKSLAEHDKNIISNKEVLDSYRKGLKDAEKKEE